MAPQLWLEFPPIDAGGTRRLLIFLHDLGGTPERFAPIAIAWQLKFPGATGIVMQATHRFQEGHAWFDDRLERTSHLSPTTAHHRSVSDPDRSASGTQARAERIRIARDEVAGRIEQLQQATGLSRAQTLIVGQGQGGLLALELARTPLAPAAVTVAYGARLASALQAGDWLSGAIHLIHGAYDSVVPAVHAQQAFRGMQALGVDVSLDILDDEAHAIGQGLVNIGTLRVMQTLFRGRSPRRINGPGPDPSNGRSLPS